MKRTRFLLLVLISDLGLGLLVGDFGQATSPLTSDKVKIQTLTVCSSSV